jgi:predicted dithiol-disulfide oxidoreductase (DUF899 family)
MAKNLKTRIEKLEAGPACSPTVEQHEAAVAHLRSAYEDHLNDSMAHLHNRFVAFIGESRLPLPQVLLVLEMLVTETIGQAKKKYLGEE